MDVLLSSECQFIHGCTFAELPILRLNLPCWGTAAAAAATRPAIHTLSYAIGGGNNRLHPFWKRWIWIWILLYLSFSRLAAARTSKLIMSFGGSKLEVLANCPIAARRKVVTPYHHVSLAIFISAVPHSHRVMLLLTFFNYSNRSWRLAITIGLKVCMCSVLMFPLLSWVWHPVFSVSSL